MAIQLMGALLANETEMLPNGRYVIDARTPLVIGVDEEASISDVNDFERFLPRMTAVLYLWNGKPGEPYNLMAAITSPSGEPVLTTDVVHRTWVGPSLEVGRCNIGGLEVNFKGVGIYRIAILLKGEELTELRLPVVFQRDLPSFTG